MAATPVAPVPTTTPVPTTADPATTTPGEWRLGEGVTLDGVQIVDPAPVADRRDDVADLELPPPATISDQGRAADAVETVGELLAVWWFDPPETWFELSGVSAHLTTTEMAVGWATLGTEAIPATDPPRATTITATRVSDTDATVSVRATRADGSADVVVVYLVDIGGAWRVDGLG